MNQVDRYMKWEITNASIITPEKHIDQGNLLIRDGYIQTISNTPSPLSGIVQADLNGMLVFPGLINCHDHLLGTYFPRVGDRKPYLNWLIWDNDLKLSSHYAERQQIESIDLYMLGGYRHLISGVTSVQDHIPHFVQDMFKDSVPIHVIDNYGVAHSVGSFALPWGRGIELEHKLSVENNMPFITHCSEGFDEETKRSVEVLESKNALSENTVLIHGICFSDEDIKLLAKRKVNVIWCPVSNLYMYNATAQIKKLLDSNINVALGTDSPMSGSINIFEEMYIARSYYEETYSEKLSNKTLIQMLTTSAAKAMFLDDRGSLEEGKLADILVIDGNKKNPYTSIANMDFLDIMLVVVGGRPKYADANFIQLFEALDIPHQKNKGSFL